jgi:hypothetical protein
MWRSLFCLLSVGGVAATAGCTDHGTYQVAWKFFGTDAFQPGDCGAHGVDSIRLIGSDTAGDGDNFSVLCTLGQATQSVTVGTWTFAVHQIDVRGLPIDPPQDLGGAPTATGDIPKDRTVMLDPPLIDLTPRPQCSDGIDNDCNGRVDLDDPSCAGDPNGAVEYTPGSPGC